MEEHSALVDSICPALSTPKQPVRFKNTVQRKQYMQWDSSSVDEETIELIDENTRLWEKAVMSLRCGILNNFSAYESVLEADYADKLAVFLENSMLVLEEDTLIVTSRWFDVFNSIVTDLFV